jgi:hypothetical protein
LPAPVSETLRTFLQQRLASLDQIDVVLLLMRDPSRSWTAPEVATELKTAPQAAAMRLFLLASGGLIAFEPTSVPRYRYVGGDEELEQCLRELAEIYPADRKAIVDVVEPGAQDPIRSFADAFKLKK